MRERWRRVESEGDRVREWVGAENDSKCGRDREWRTVEREKESR